MLAAMIHRDFNCAVSTGCGRVFDGVAALLRRCEYNDFDAQAGMALEAAAGEAEAPGDAHRYDILAGEEGDPDVIDLSPLVRWLAEEVEAGGETSTLAAAYHETLAAAWAEGAHRAAERTGVRTVGLTGGVFCNELLTRRLTDRLASQGLEVLRHRVVPPNDGGISYGQAAIAAVRRAGI